MQDFLHSLQISYILIMTIYKRSIHKNELILVGANMHALKLQLIFGYLYYFYYGFMGLCYYKENIFNINEKHLLPELYHWGCCIGVGYVGSVHFLEFYAVL